MAFIPPTKIVFSGNHSACNEHIKFALNQLAILERQMSFQNLNEGVRRISPYLGVFVECISSFSKHEVRIHVAPVRLPLPLMVPEKPVEKVKLVDELPCLNFPIIAAGKYIKDFAAPGIPYLGKRYCFLDNKEIGSSEPIKSCEPTTEKPAPKHFTKGETSFLQVRYEKAPVQIADMQDGVAVEITKNLIMSLAIATSANEEAFEITHRIRITATQEHVPNKEDLAEDPSQVMLHLDGLEGFDLNDLPLEIEVDGYIHTLSKKIKVSPCITVHKFEFLLPDRPKNTQLSANFSEDFSRLYVVYYDNGDVTRIIYKPFIKNQLNESGSIEKIISWMEIEKSTISHPLGYTRKFLYVSREGYIYGYDKSITAPAETLPLVGIDLHESIGISKQILSLIARRSPQGGTLYSVTHEYLRINIVTLEEEITEYCSEGVGIANGDFSGVFIAKDPSFPDYFMIDSCLAVDTYYTGYYRSVPTNTGYGGCGAGYVDKIVNGVPIVIDPDAFRIAPQTGKVGFFDDSMTFNFASSGGYPDEVVNFYGAYEGILNITGAINISSTRHTHRLTTTTTAIPPGEFWPEDAEQLVRDTKSHIYGNVGPGHYFVRQNIVEERIGAQSLTRALGTAEYYWSTPDTPSWYSYPALLRVPSTGQTENKPETQDILSPFEVLNAKGLHSFIAWDNNTSKSNPNGIIIKGLRYTEYPGETEDNLIVEMNGKDILANVLDKTGINPDNLHYLGFIL